jgi:hypothetical protein
MQKVVGSNPISRFAEGLRLQVFFVRAVGRCVCFAPDRNRTRGKPAVHFGSKSEAICGEFSIVRTVDILRRRAEGHEFDPSSESGFGPQSGVSASRPHRPPRQSPWSPSRSLSPLRQGAPDASSSSNPGVWPHASFHTKANAMTRAAGEAMSGLVRGTGRVAFASDPDHRGERRVPPRGACRGREMPGPNTRRTDGSQ